MRVSPDEGFEAGAGNSLRYVMEKLQAELTQEVVLSLQGHQDQFGTHTA